MIQTPGYVIYVIDTETTNLDSSIGDVIEIAACRIIFDDKWHPHTETKSWCLKALNPAGISDEALAVNGHKREDILCMTKYGQETYLPPDQVVPQIELWMAEDNVSSLDRIFAGQNCQFDIGYLQALWKKTGSPETFPFDLGNNNRIIDTKQLAIMVDICTGRRRLQYNLSSLVKAFGVKKLKAHRAEADTIMCADLLTAILKPIQPILSEKFKESYHKEDKIS